MIASIEVATRGTGGNAGGNIADGLPETQVRMVRSLLGCLASLVKIELEGRPDGDKEAVKQAIIKRLLLEWSRTSLTSYSYPLLLQAVSLFGDVRMFFMSIVRHSPVFEHTAMLVLEMFSKA